jgi:hypothetical protein
MSAAQQVSRMERGQFHIIRSHPATGTVTNLVNGLADYGMEAAEIEVFQIAAMCEAALVERLNDIRLSDKVLIITGWVRDMAAIQHKLAYTIEQCFSQQGGRTVMVTYG